MSLGAKGALWLSLESPTGCETAYRRLFLDRARDQMKIPMVILALVLVAPVTSAAQIRAGNTNGADDPVYAAGLKFQGLLASRSGDQRAFLLVGGGFLRGLRSGNPATFISNWLAAHPMARVTPISRMFTTNRISRRTGEMVYIWLDDAKDSLNVDMVRVGLFPGAAMHDMVDNLQGLTRLLKDPKLAGVRAQIEKERPEAPRDRTERVVTDVSYKAYMHRIDMAEGQARAEKLGIWSDAMKDERQAEGFP
jgi:hypothetical protein